VTPRRTVTVRVLPLVSIVCLLLGNFTFLPTELQGLLLLAGVVCIISDVVIEVRRWWWRHRVRVGR
jgi:hypothetical protein